MIRLVADENFDGRACSGLRRRSPDLDLVRVQDVGLTGAEDPDILDWAARENRVLVTFDAATLPSFVHDRVARGLPMPGLILVQLETPLGEVIDGLLVLALAGRPEDFVDRVTYLP